MEEYRGSSRSPTYKSTTNNEMGNGMGMGMGNPYPPGKLDESHERQQQHNERAAYATGPVQLGDIHTHLNPAYSR
jgi:hypothetical protein